MFRAILQTQWKWSRAVVLLAVLAAFSIPLFSLRLARHAFDGREFIGAMQAFGGAYAFTAAMLGLLLAIAAWHADHRGRHVYALALPVARWRYALMRFGAGSLFLVPPTIALLVSALIVSSNDAIPVGLHAYPVALTFRFAFAALVAFAIFFAIAAGTARTARLVLGAIALIIVAQLLVGAAGLKVDIIDEVADFVFASPGLLAVISGRWMLIDI